MELKAESEQSEEPQALALLKEEFKGIFEVVGGLPLGRFHNHAIRLQPNAKTPKLRPYRYPYY